MTIKKEAIWVFSSTGVSAVSQLIILVLLARTGDSNVLGELSIINIVLALAFLLQDMGLSSFFIHRQTLSKPEKSSLFAINLLLGLAATLIVLLIASPMGDFYQSDKVREGLIVVAFNFLIIGVTSQYQAQLIKSLKNDLLAKVEIASKVAMLCCVTYLMFVANLSLFAYLYAILFASFTKLILILYIAPKSWHPSLDFDKAIVKAALGYGCYQMGSQLINQLRTQVDQLVIGKVLGMEMLGVYSLAKELVMQPTKLIAPLTSKLVLPRLAKVQHSDLESEALFHKASQAIIFTNSLIYLLLTIALYYAIPVFFGATYAISFQVYTILLLIGMLRPIGGLFGALCQAQGFSNVEFKWNLISSIVGILALVVALIFSSLNAFAVAMVTAQLMLSIYAAFYFSAFLNCINKKAHLYRVALICLVYLFMQVALSFSIY